MEKRRPRLAATIKEKEILNVSSKALLAIRSTRIDLVRAGVDLSEIKESEIDQACDNANFIDRLSMPLIDFFSFFPRTRIHFCQGHAGDGQGVGEKSSIVFGVFDIGITHDYGLLYYTGQHLTSRHGVQKVTPDLLHQLNGSLEAGDFSIDRDHTVVKAFGKVSKEQILKKIEAAITTKCPAAQIA